MMMCLTVAAVAAMSVVGRVRAEEADNGRGNWQLCSVIYFSPFFF
jgi:hypothetical protein